MRGPARVYYGNRCFRVRSASIYVIGPGLHIPRLRVALLLLDWLLLIITFLLQPAFGLARD